MSEQPPRDPHDPADDETIVARDGWGEETVVEPGYDRVEHVEEEEVPLRRRLPPIWPGLLALLLLVLIGAGVLWALSRDDDENGAAATTTAQTDMVSVPDVIGSTVDDATAALTAAGFEVDVNSVPADEIAGTVVAQDPGGGEEAEEGSRVRINVSREVETTETETEAATTEQTTTEQTTTEQTTTQRTTTQQATTPPPPATVPDVVGQALADAAEAFGDEGLKLSVKYVPSSEAFGTVVAQAQDPGTELKRGDTVQVNVSPGADPPPNARVPDVRGDDERAAREALERANFEVLSIELDGLTKEVVGGQTPSANSSVPRGSLVILYVGRR